MSSLDSRPVPVNRLGRFAKVLAIIMTHGCKFHCPYCSIHAYNQGPFRMYQVLGNLGLVRSAWASRGWLGRLKWGRIEKASAAPGPKYQLVLPSGRSLQPAEPDIRS
jgi:pyruvate-formate lyase-activating enzyme